MIMMVEVMVLVVVLVMMMVAMILMLNINSQCEPTSKVNRVEPTQAAKCLNVIVQVHICHHRYCNH